MTKSDLTEIIRKIVAEEIKKQFPSLLAEILNSTKKPALNERKQPVQQPQRKRVEISTGNPALDAILRETTAGFAGASYESPSVDVDSAFGFIGEGIDAPVTEQVDMIPSEVPLNLPFMKKDYSLLLKKADKAASSMRGASRPL